LLKCDNLYPKTKKEVSYRSTRNSQLNLPPIRTHQSPKLLADALQHAQAVVLGQRLEEVLDGVALVLNADLARELVDDAVLVGGAEGWGEHDVLQLGVALEHRSDVFEGFGDGVEGLLLGGCGVLYPRG